VVTNSVITGAFIIGTTRSVTAAPIWAEGNGGSKDRSYNGVDQMHSHNCNEAGVCFTEAQLAAEAGATYSTPWDAQMHVGCICDIGRRGPDCSLIECPSGPDVLKGYGNESGRDCSGRGLCDYSSGKCSCFHGYYGNECQFQTVLG